jgi:hypothetical protein
VTGFDVGMKPVTLEIFSALSGVQPVETLKQLVEHVRK